MLTAIFYGFIFIYGIVIGSFLNVCILRIPLKETIVSKRSHCMSCGHQLAWYDLFPLFSYLFLGGKCRYCKAKISKQYPIVEGLNGALACLCFAFGGFFPHLINSFSDWVKIGEYSDGRISEISDWVYPWMQNGFLLLNCLVISALIVIAVVDWRTFEIPLGANIFILVLGLIKLGLTIASEIHYKGIFETLNSDGSMTFLMDKMWLEYVIGFFVVSVPLYLIVVISKGRAMGGGDVKLMAAAGLFLGWKLALVALILGCFYGSVIHIIRMKVSGEGKQLAMGPYLAAGIVSAMWFGSYIVEWYASFF